MNAREVVRAARLTIEAARERLRNGDALVIFGEGTRSQTRVAIAELLPAEYRGVYVSGRLGGAQQVLSRCRQ
jgi:1-acyl-sn-glycerol-3-phosphate acyltransferase